MDREEKIENRGVRNFGRFFCVWNRIQVFGDREELRHELVKQYTNGRTDSMKEMTQTEYNALCYDLEHKTLGTPKGAEIRKKRSICLKLMQQVGLDTNNWDIVNGFCLNKRIADKVFAKLTAEELDELALKLRAIEKKGGLKLRPSPASSRVYVLAMPGEASWN